MGKLVNPSTWEVGQDDQEFKARLGHLDSVSKAKESWECSSMVKCLAGIAENLGSISRLSACPSLSLSLLSLSKSSSDYTKNSNWPIHLIHRSTR